MTDQHRNADAGVYGPEYQGQTAAPKIERDEQMNRDYIPLPGGWELQTKGNGSTLRLLDKKTGEREPLPLPDHIIEFIERMGREVYTAVYSPPEATANSCQFCQKPILDQERWLPTRAGDVPGFSHSDCVTAAIHAAPKAKLTDAEVCLMIIAMSKLRNGSDSPQNVQSDVIARKIRVYFGLEDRNIDDVIAAHRDEYRVLLRRVCNITDA